MIAIEDKTTVILLAGGLGTRMKGDIPKQFLLLKNKPIVCHSFDLFLSMPEMIAEIVVVCAPLYRHLFQFSHSPVPVTFALPGERRQDSVLSGLEAMSLNSGYVCIHDGARPLIDSSLVKRVLEAAYMHGAASVGMPVKFTLKELDASLFVRQTPDRSNFWEIQTPQAIKTTLLKEGFCKVKEEGLSVTDDASIVEYLGLPVKMVEGSYSNIKVTTPDDFFLCERLLG